MSKAKSKSNRKAARSAQNKNLPLIIGAAVVLLLVVVGLVWASQQGAQSSLAATISVDDAYEMYQDGAFVLDVREVSEWDEYHAPNTTLIPLGELPSRLAEIPTDRPIVVVCRSGNRSQEGRDILLEAGFTDVTSMSGGLSAWRSAGYPIEP